MKHQVNSRLNDIVSKIKKMGYSLTPQRLEIIKIVSESKSHPSAVDVYDKLRKAYPMISLNTVYKNLSLLSSIHEVKEIRTLQNSVHYDGDISLHGHAICEKCGRIIDVKIDESDFKGFFDAKIKENFKENYYINNYGLEFYGLCDLCYNETASNESISGQP
ncbi:MAG: Fur family transcriptional regulator [Candidatus Acidulodesulfobacterium sp.]